jgi:hypothetical protein
MIRIALFSLLAAIMASCAQPERSLVNAAHLGHLYEEIVAGNDTLGTIWIYCEAPDYQHVGDEDEGFTCVDDVARALAFYCREYKQHPSPDILEKIRSLTAFVFYMQAPDGYFYNFMLPGNEINTTHQNSVAIPGWWTWRAMWALSELNLLEEAHLADLQTRSRQLIDSLVVKMENFCPNPADTLVFDGISVPACFSETLGADQAGVILIALANHYQIAPSQRLKDLMLGIGNLVLRMQLGDADTWPYGAFLSWRNYWHAWGNLQAYGLLFSGETIQHQPFIDAGLREVRHFYPYFLEKEHFAGFEAVREADSLNMQEFNQFPQIAYNIRPMVFASLEAFTITGDSTYFQTARSLTDWLSGANPAGERMYDPSTGRTFDGIISPEQINRNSGAESTIEALLTIQAYGIH